MLLYVLSVFFCLFILKIDRNASGSSYGTNLHVHQRMLLFRFYRCECVFGYARILMRMLLKRKHTRTHTHMQSIYRQTHIYRTTQNGTKASVAVMHIPKMKAHTKHPKMILPCALALLLLLLMVFFSVVFIHLVLFRFVLCVMLCDK